MEGIYVGKIKRSVIGKDGANLFFVDHRQDITHLGSLIEYDDTTYCLVPSDDIIANNDELLKLRDEVKRLTDECDDWKVRYSTVNNKLFQKGLAYGTLEGAYKNEKIAGEILLKDRDALKERVEKLEAELTEIKTTRTLREAYITGVEKGCESLREERDRWKNRWNSVVTDIGESLKANGITFVLKEIHGDGNWDVVIDIPELTEAKKKVEDLEKKLEAAKSKETFWRGRKEEEEDYHHYWLHTFDRAVKKAAEKGIHIGVCGTDEECNAGVVTLDNMKAEELKKQIVTLEKTNKNLDQKHDAKWSAMCDALKAKGVEVIYMGEEDGKPIVDVKIPAIDILRKDYVVRGQIISDLKKELEELKSRTLDNVEIRLSCGDIVWTYCDGFSHVSSNIDIDPANCLCKNYVTVDAESISHGTIPKCKTCKNHRYFTNGGHLCHRPDSKYKIPGMFHVQSLTEEEAEGPACSDFKARKE